MLILVGWLAIHMSGPIFSEDGLYMWTGTEWIPAPPTSAIVPQESIDNVAIQDVAKQYAVSPEELGEVAPYFDIDGDGVLDQGELEQAAKSVFKLGARPSFKPGEDQPDYQFHQGPILAPGSLKPSQNYDFSEANTRRIPGGKFVAFGAIFVALLVAGLFVYSSLDSLGLVDDLESDDISDGENPENIVDNNNSVQPEISSTELDSDGDGINNSNDTDDDNDGFSDLDEVLNCQYSLSDPLDNNSTPNDFDGDYLCDYLDSDDDNDGVDDSTDEFPLDSSESTDHDNDGIGDNADLDDDNDGVADSIDVNDFADTSLLFVFTSVKPIEQMDWLDDQTELYFCLEVNGINQGCVGDPWSISTGQEYVFEHEVLIDLPEDSNSHEVSISMWDEDYSSDDLMDINPYSGIDSYSFTYDSSNTDSETIDIIASGEGDGDGWDGVLEFSITPKDLIQYGAKSFEWDFNQQTYTLDWDLDYSIYYHFKQLDHSVSSDSDYTRFSTPHEMYIINLSNELDSMAQYSGYTSDLDRAEFILSFVQHIPYQYDLNANSEHTEYPKYPIEMLWENAGDCEDAAALYISIMEALNYDATLILLEIKSDNGEDDEWGGHAIPAIHIPNHSGDGKSWTEGDKANTPFYYAESTAPGWNIGDRPWDEEQNVQMYDIE